MRVINEWREVCRWDVEPSGPVNPPIDWCRVAIKEGQRANRLEEQLADLVAHHLEMDNEHDEEMYRAWDAFDNMAAAFEELAGEHRELQEALHRELEAEIRDIEADLDPDTVTVRPHRRHKPRRSAKFGGWYLCDECGEPHDNPPGPCPRRSKSVSNSPTPTEDTAEAVSASQAKPDDVTEGYRGGRTLWECQRCHRVVTSEAHICIVETLSPEAAELVRQGLEDCAEGRVAVCRWEVGRWGICGAS